MSVRRFASQPITLLRRGSCSYSLPNIAYISSLSVSLTSSIYINFFPCILINKSSFSFMFISFKYLSALLLFPCSHCSVPFMFSFWQLLSNIEKKPKISFLVRYSFRSQAATYIFRTVYRDWDVDGEILLMSTVVLLLTVLGPWFHPEILWT